MGAKVLEKRNQWSGAEEKRQAAKKSKAKTTAHTRRAIIG